MKKTILITGIAGFVGSSLAHKLILDDRGYNIVGIDNFSYGYKERISHLLKKIRFFEMDLFDINRLPDDLDIDCVVHCAAIAPLPENESNTPAALTQNISGCGAVAEFCSKRGIKNLIFFSSAAVYEGSSELVSRETDEIKTSLVYPTTKYLSEKFLESYATTYGLKVCAIRLFNLYGPRQDYFRRQPPLLGYLIRNLIEKKEVTIYASHDAKRDYIFIDDLLDLLVKIEAAFDAESPAFDVYNAGSENVYSVYEIIKTLERVSGCNLAYKKGEPGGFWGGYDELFNRELPLPLKVIEAEINKIAIADISKAKLKFDWTPTVTMDAGIRACYEYAVNEIIT